MRRYEKKINRFDTPSQPSVTGGQLGVTASQPHAKKRAQPSDIHPVNFIRTDAMSKGFNFKTKPANTVSKAPTKPTTLTSLATSTPAQSTFDQLPESGYVRESQLVRSPKNPGSAIAPLPFSAPTLWRKVAAGTFPKPIKLSERVTCWKVSEVRAWMTAQAMA
jgi:prophage regulatory protein